MDFEVRDFQEDVLDTSKRTPVVVDFWAPWCGPCRVLGPVLERLAQEEDNGQWKLVKVNTDRHPEVSRSYGIRGIPAVKLFVDGDVVDEFTGALPEYAVKQWLEKALPSENKQRVERAQAEIDAGNQDAAKRLLETVLEEEPQNPRARVLLGQLIALDDPQRALEMVTGSSFAGSGFIQIEEAVRTIAHLYETSETGVPDGDGADDYRAAIDALKSHDFETSLEKFIEVIQKDRYYDDDGARKACVALFTLLGNDHPAVKKNRRTFDMVLY